MNASERQRIVERATYWYARACAPDFNEAERQRFASWLTEHAEHQQAYRQVVSTAQQVSQQASVDPRLRALADAALKGGGAENSDLAGRVSNGIAQRWRSAAALLFAVGLGVFMMRAEQPQPLYQEHYSMARFANDGIRKQRVVLEDGSIVHLDVGAQLEAFIGKNDRRIELVKGRAYFEVAHDSSRPFSVVAAGTHTVALGTKFEVAVKAQGVNVTLAEGSVAVTGSTAQWRELMRPGQQLQIHAADGSRVIQAVNTALVTSWSTGRLVFDGTPLAQALEELNRYASTKVSLGDPTLAAIPIGGNFVAGADSDEFVAALTAVLPLRSVRVGANEVVLFERYATH